MHQGQTQFYDFIMERVRGGNEEEAKILLNESFARQAIGTFNKEYLNALAPRILELIQPEYQAEVRDVMESFAANLPFLKID